MSAIDLFTRRFIDAPAPGIAPVDRSYAKMVQALRSVDADIHRCGAITYESAELVREALRIVIRD